MTLVNTEFYWIFLRVLTEKAWSKIGCPDEHSVSSLYGVYPEAWEMPPLRKIE
jgi:hypothetical protein